jgi:hypothetical protein
VDLLDCERQQRLMVTVNSMIATQGWGRRGGVDRLVRSGQGAVEQLDDGGHHASNA